MTTASRLAALALMAAAASPAAMAQNFTGMDLNAMNAQFNAQMNSAMGAQTNQIVTSNMNNPRVIAMYRQAVAQGYRGDLATYAYNYAATGGFSREGMINYQNATNAINTQTRNSQTAYLNSQGAYRDAYNQYTGNFSNNMQEAGRGLMGQSTYYGAGGSVQLPHTWAANTQHYYQGNTYAVDQSGRYWVAGYNGWYPLNR